MEIGQLIVQIFAAIGSLASGAMLIYSIIIFKKNIIKSEAIKLRNGLFLVERDLMEIGNSICIEKAQIYEFLTKEPIHHTLLSIYNKIQVSYKNEIMRKVISDKLHEILPIRQISLFKYENEYLKISEMKREFSVSLRKMNALKFLIYSYCNDYQNRVESLQAFFDENSLIENIISVFSENANRLITFESFLDALCMKCYDSLNKTNNEKKEVLNLSYKLSSIIINALLDILEDKELVKNANESQQFFSEAILQNTEIKDLFTIYDKYYKKTLITKGVEVNNDFTHKWSTYAELKQKSL